MCGLNATQDHNKGMPESRGFLNWFAENIRDAVNYKVQQAQNFVERCLHGNERIDAGKIANNAKKGAFDGGRKRCN